MSLPITIPNTFATASGNISLALLDANFSAVANGINGIGNGTNALTNVLISGGSISGITALGISVGGTALTTAGSNGAVITSSSGAFVNAYPPYAWIAGVTGISSASTQDFTNIPQTFSHLMVQWSLVPATNNDKLQIFASTNNGSSYDTTAANYSYATQNQIVNQAGAAYNGTSNAAGLGDTNNSLSATAANGGTSGQLVIRNYSSTTSNKLSLLDSTHYDNAAGGQARVSGITAYKSTSAINAIRLQFSTGAIASGSVQLFGLRTS